jgi:hypothetical protein
MVLLGAATALLYMQIGVLALALFTLLVAIPQVVLPILLQPRPVSEMGHGEAVSLYVRAISSVLELDGRTRLVLEDASRFMRRRAEGSEPPELSSAGVGHVLDLREAVLFHREHWDGHGGTPGAVGGEMIPLTSRILAVADAWAGLTADRSPALTHSQALAQLEARAGLHFDPTVVTAVEKIIESERLGLSADAAYAPRLHSVRFPRLQLNLGASLEEAS